MTTPQRRPVWLLLAITSGTCAAFNGVFAKLTTTELTTSWSRTVSSVFGVAPAEAGAGADPAIEYLLRGAFFGLNLAFNVAMWALFTAALTRAASSTRVSIVNVSANFVVTALLGRLVFGEELAPTWWVGAALLAAGNVVIGRRDEGAGGQKAGVAVVASERGGAGADDGDGVPLMADGDEAGVDMIDLDEDIARSERTREALKKGEDVDAPLR